MDRALEELIFISRQVGADPDLVQGGGGNTSVKSRGGKTIFVKASGTALAGMSAGAGWAELDLAAAREMFQHRRLLDLPAAERERRVLALLAAAVVRPPGARPSVESNLHAILDRVVIHTHPAGLNAFLCSRSSRKSYLELVGRRFGEPLYVRYIDPGFILACRLEDELKRYRRRHGLLPKVVLLENHGLFVGAPEVKEALAISKAITGIGRRFAGGRINPRRFAGTVSMDRAIELAGLKEALAAGGAASPGALAWDRAPIAREFIASRQGRQAARRGAFTPDQIVYCRTYPLLLTGHEAPAQAVADYRRKRGFDPRVIIIPGQGVFYAAPDASLLKIVAEVYRSAMAAILRSKQFGGPRFLNRKQAAFIESWEVEAFRAKCAEGKKCSWERTRSRSSPTATKTRTSWPYT
ncbi:MAG: class II aldolase [Planctomycetes bacterium]|nr:class II aldolase [Planctomycetota bacterium]